MPAERRALRVAARVVGVARAVPVVPAHVAEARVTEIEPEQVGRARGGGLGSDPSLLEALLVAAASGARVVTAPAPSTTAPKLSSVAALAPRVSRGRYCSARTSSLSRSISRIRSRTADHWLMFFAGLLIGAILA